MIENVRTAFTDNLPNLDWMDDATRAAALDKVMTNSGFSNVFVCVYV